MNAPYTIMWIDMSQNPVEPLDIICAMLVPNDKSDSVRWDGDLAKFNELGKAAIEFELVRIYNTRFL